MQEMASSSVAPHCMGHFLGPVSNLDHLPIYRGGTWVRQVNHTKSTSIVFAADIRLGSKGKRVNSTF